LEDSLHLFKPALTFFLEGNLSEARRLSNLIIASDKKNTDALHLLGLIAYKMKSFLEAEGYFLSALGIGSGSPQMHTHYGLVLQSLGRYEDAIKHYKIAINKNPNFMSAHLNLGVAFRSLNYLEEALSSFEKVISINIDDSEAFNNHGAVLFQLGRIADSLKSYDEAISIRPDYAEAFFNRGISLQELKCFDEALASYDQAVSIKSDYAEAFNNRGVVLGVLRRFNDALASYDQAISINSDYVEAFNNRGIALRELKRFDEALASYDQAISIKSDYAEAFNSRGVTLEELRRFGEALASYDKAISIKPDYEWLFGSWLHIRMQTSDWSNLEQNLRKFQCKIQDMKSVTRPFPVLALFDDLELNLKAAQQWIDKKYPSNQLAMPFEKKIFKSRIRIGYFSADFHNHATAYLMAELFERHDQTRFELYAFSFGPDSVDEMRQRIQASFVKFMDVRFQSDRDVAALSRTLGIDIAIDLKGFTQDARTGIFAYQCAPIQVSYIGYPGTMSAEYIDYIIADKILIPVESQKYYSEKVVYLPHSYQVNDSKRQISSKKFNRTELGLPEHGFVFCCFNNSYKILPDVFASWMRILQVVEGSVLWLLDDNAISTRNLQREASNRGISPTRIVFAKRIPLAEHLARHRCADLFLDTLPYNAHTTASDALWAGLPVLTRIGQYFAARVAASLLNAMDLPELITRSVDEYEDLAIKLATHPDEMGVLRQKLADNTLSSKLFDTPLYVGHLEAAYSSMYQRYQNGDGPDHIYVQDKKR
jgi:predicted O-linked N-acetylglucosamine transferase (SPINDLY family)